MDFVKLDVISGANAGFDVQLTHPGTAENLPLFIRVLGSDSDEYRRIEAEQNRKRIDKVWKGGVFRASAQTAEETEEQTITKLASVTKEWGEVLADGTKRASFENKGKLLECSVENAALLYRENPWVKEQVFAAVNDRQNFIKG